MSRSHGVQRHDFLPSPSGPSDGKGVPLLPVSGALSSLTGPTPLPSPPDQGVYSPTELRRPAGAPRVRSCFW